MKEKRTFKKFDNITEDKGYDLAFDFVQKARAKMRKMSDDEVQSFRKYIATAFDLKRGL